jgi:hypothetical protein
MYDMNMTTAVNTTRPAAKAPAPRGRKKTHTKPVVPREAQQAEAVTKQMYQSLTAPGAPKASPMGYIMGASMVLKMLIDQAVQQGENRDALKAQAMTYIQSI